MMISSVSLYSMDREAPLITSEPVVELIGKIVPEVAQADACNFDLLRTVDCKMLLEKYPIGLDLDDKNTQKKKSYVGWNDVAYTTPNCIKKCSVSRSAVTTKFLTMCERYAYWDVVQKFKYQVGCSDLDPVLFMTIHKDVRSTCIAFPIASLEQLFSSVEYALKKEIKNEKTVFQGLGDDACRTEWYMELNGKRVMIACGVTGAFVETEQPDVANTALQLLFGADSENTRVAWQQKVDAAISSCRPLYSLNSFDQEFFLARSDSAKRGQRMCDLYSKKRNGSYELVRKDVTFSDELLDPVVLDGIIDGSRIIYQNNSEKYNVVVWDGVTRELQKRSHEEWSISSLLKLLYSHIPELQTSSHISCEVQRLIDCKILSQKDDKRYLLERTLCADIEALQKSFVEYIAIYDDLTPFLCMRAKTPTHTILIALPLLLKHHETLCDYKEYLRSDIAMIDTDQKTGIKRFKLMLSSHDIVYLPAISIIEFDNADNKDNTHNVPWGPDDMESVLKKYENTEKQEIMHGQLFAALHKINKDERIRCLFSKVLGEPYKLVSMENVLKNEIVVDCDGAKITHGSAKISGSMSALTITKYTVWRGVIDEYKKQPNIDFEQEIKNHKRRSTINTWISRLGWGAAFTALAVGWIVVIKMSMKHSK